MQRKIKKQYNRWTVAIVIIDIFDSPYRFPYTSTVGCQEISPQAYFALRKERRSRPETSTVKSKLLKHQEGY